MFAAAVGVIAECSWGEFTTIFKKWEVTGKGVAKLYHEAVMQDAFDRDRFRGFGHWVEALLSKGFLTKHTFFS